MDNKSILQSILSTPPSDWGEFLEQFRQQKYKQISTATPEKLLEIQQYVKAMDYFENVIKNVHKDKKLP